MPVAAHNQSTRFSAYSYASLQQVFHSLSTGLSTGWSKLLVIARSVATKQSSSPLAQAIWIASLRSQ
jgi:hypothetical protein